MIEDWESVLARLEKGNMVRDRFGHFDLRSKVCCKPVGSGKVQVVPIKTTVSKYIIEHDYSSVWLPLSLVFLAIILLILLFLLSSVVAESVGASEKSLPGTRQLNNAGRQQVASGTSAIIPAGIQIQKVKCNATELFACWYKGECACL